MEKETHLIDYTCVAEEFSASALFRQLAQYKGPKDPAVLVREYVEEETASREEEARKGGTLPLMQPSETIRPRVMRSLSEYVSLMTRISDFVCDRTREQFDKKRLRVMQVRTCFDFVTWLVRLLFVVDAAAEETASFERLLRTVEMVVLEEERFTAELSYLNKRGRKIDYKRLFHGYPFIRSDEKP
jgi:hypothetical protein